MLAFEKDLFEELMKSIDASDKVLNELLNGREEKEAENELLVFIENVTEFMGIGGEKMGPYDKGQIANLPKKIARILVEGKKAEKVPSD